MHIKIIVSLIIPLLIFSQAQAIPVSDAANPHNLSSGSAVGSVKAVPTSLGGTDQICVFCHTPHSGASQTPLWSRPDPTLMGSFPVYGIPLGINQDAAAEILTGYYESNPDYPSGASRMCLSCHDGVTSVGVLLGNKTIVMEGGLTNLPAGVDLATSHPISFNYNIDVINTLLNTTEYQLPDGTVDTPLDSNGQMQCTTCHDPHEDTRAITALPFWRHTSGAFYDDVCGSCHVGGTPVTAPHLP